QGRYLFGGLVGVFVLVAIAASKHLGRWAGPAICGFAIAIQFDALRRCLQAWWGAPDIGPRGQMRAMVAWSGWPGEFVWLLILAAVVAVGWLAVEVARQVRPLGSETQ
ncbi:MAG: hypothetical protein KDA95_12650, partial [Acidimicrobiales bacterium]|nr:hypothetical protein [Acidimicrobiales bacterium]